ncbi:phosphatidylglycerol:prolipoprotein diacylglycerol transferase [Anaerosolibacter carboniphilus]|uniref:Phosphatidylglycerol--prolipoprotein diacylglyceryl transferase n=1 Tax=Anaerosolibacter carboniphilus TaxID=1417629 RepID=A0A841KV38_9FIRM|nr:phosphatidylglycerol:prolipoprotein diacylglycerol transferase [Anaerosolibacter carboniphilus]
MKELFRVGDLGIYVFGVAIAFGMLAGLWIMMKEARRKGMDSSKMLDLALYTMIAAVVGARIYYILAFNFDHYLQNPIEIFHFRSGGLSIQGALISGVLFALWYTKKNNISFLQAADTFAPGIIIGQAIGRIGCDVFGVPMRNVYPWAVKVGNQLLHPAQLYEMFLDLILFAYLWRGRTRIKYNGELFIKYIIGFSINRAIVEFFRSNPIVIQPFSIAHITSFVIIILALFIGRIIKRKQSDFQKDLVGSEVNVSILEYVFIAAIGLIGTWIYYNIH